MAVFKENMIYGHKVELHTISMYHKILLFLCFSLNHLKMSKLILSLYVGCAPTGVGLAFAQGCGLPGPLILEFLWQGAGGRSQPCQPGVGIRGSLSEKVALQLPPVHLAVLWPMVISYLEHRVKWPVNGLQCWL